MIKHGLTVTEIDQDSASKAIALAMLLIEHARAAFNQMGLNEDARIAKEIYDWIRRKGFRTFIKYDVTQKMKGKFKTRQLDTFLEVLASRHIISEPVSEGKKTLRYTVNPALCE